MMSMPRFSHKAGPFSGLTLACLTLPAIALAQVAPTIPRAPDAGRLLQEQKAPPAPPRESPDFKFEQPLPAAGLAGGATVTLGSVSFAGNTLIDSATLLAVLGEVVGKSYDMAGLRGLSDQISAHYRAAGYPFARAYLPPQPLTDGQLRIELVEGRYGAVKATGEEPVLLELAQGFLSALTPGTVIESAALERATLILDDQPGLKVSPILRPGKDVGTGDLDVYVQREPGLSGEVGIDNHGNRFTGAQRLRANLQWDNPLNIADQITLKTIYSDEDMWLGSLGYSLPVGTSGLRGNIGYAQTYYQLAKNFDDLDATGTAKVSSLGLTYPILRSQRANLNVALTYQHKKLNDQQDATDIDENKTSDSVPITLSFDQRDGWGGGGVTYGSVTYTVGDLSLDDALEVLDRRTQLDTRGGFQKLNLDVVRLQALPSGFTLYGRVSGQWAGGNLDSSEGFSLGGASAVRAYPSGEGTGDEGWLTQIELRYAFGPYSPYVFHDAGRVTINAKDDNLVPAVPINHRSISGTGLGLRYQRGDWNMDATLAWKTHGGDAESDSTQRDPRVWVSIGSKF